MSPTENTHALLELIDGFVDYFPDDVSVVSFTQLAEESDIPDAVMGVLCSDNGALIPSTVGLLKRRGYDLVTIKRSDTAGNAVVYVKAADVLMCVYYDPQFAELMALTNPTAPVESKGWFRRLLTKFFG